MGIWLCEDECEFEYTGVYKYNKVGKSVQCRVPRSRNSETVNEKELLVLSIQSDVVLYDFR